MQTALSASTQIHYTRSGLSDAELLELYRAILLPRMIEEKMLILLRQNKISKWFSGIGQEAIAVGTTKALHDKDFIFPLHRNLGVFTVRELPLVRLFSQWQGKKNGYTKGRDRSFHFGTEEHRIIGMISHLGAMLGVADGVALASNLSHDNFIALAYSGDGGASEGDFHEAINVAAVWELPVIFLVENNGYGLSTPSRDQFRCKYFIDKAIGYGIEGYQVDGNNILDVYKTTRQIAEKMRNNRQPVILEALTFRMRGHEEASGTKYVPKELMEQWGLKDPVVNYENYLISIGLLNLDLITMYRNEFKFKIDEALATTFGLPEVTADTNEELQDVYKPYVYVPRSPQSTVQNKRFVDAIHDALDEAMTEHTNLVLMGQDIAEYGGVFKVTQGLVEKYGKARVRNTPLCESAIIAAGLGLSLCGYSSVIEMQFADFVSCGFNQIVNNLAKTYYRWQHTPSVVIRMPTGAGVAAGPFHSQSNESWFFHVPGLKLIYPSNPSDAKGMLLAAIADPSPVIYFEHKVMYRSIQGDVPDGYYTVELGKASVVQKGCDITVVTYGMGVHWAIEATKEFPDASIEIIDLKTLLPWDVETVSQSVIKTGKCIVLHEDTLTGGIGAEIAAYIAEHLFEKLDAPVLRIGSLDTPVPFAKNLEDSFLPQQRFKSALSRLINY